MTEKQTKFFYFPAWNKLLKQLKSVGASDRESVERRASERESVVEFGSEEWVRVVEERFRGLQGPAGAAGLRVMSFAVQFAVRRGVGESRRVGEWESRSVGACRVTAEDLRHACNVVAVGKESSKHLNNTEVNHCVALFELLAGDPDSVANTTNFLHPEIKQKEGLIKFIERQAPEGTLRAIFNNAYDSKEWRDGDLQQLRWLLKQVKGRQKKWKAPITKHQDPVNNQDPKSKEELELQPF